MLCLWFFLLELMLCTLPCMHTGWPKTKTIMSIDIITNHKKPKLAKKTSSPFTSQTGCCIHTVYFSRRQQRNHHEGGQKTPNKTSKSSKKGRTHLFIISHGWYWCPNPFANWEHDTLDTCWCRKTTSWVAGCNNQVMKQQHETRCCSCSQANFQHLTCKQNKSHSYLVSNKSPLHPHLEVDYDNSKVWILATLSSTSIASCFLGSMYLIASKTFLLLFYPSISNPAKSHRQPPPLSTANIASIFTTSDSLVQEWQGTVTTRIFTCILLGDPQKAFICHYC